MRDDFIRVAAATPKIRVADPRYNREKIEELMNEACRQQVKVLINPAHIMAYEPKGEEVEEK